MKRNDGRWTAELDGDFVVFIIGATVRNPFKALKALPLLGQMPKMLADLSKDPGKGLLGFQRHGGPFGVIVQYWRSFEDLERFARSTEDRHSKVWRDWYAKAQHKNSSVGIWHETYKVRAGDYEAVYQNMPPIGLAKAGRSALVGAKAASARQRAGIAEPAPLPAPVEEAAVLAD
jgi:fumigallin biosynthesis monooxygenase-like protein